MKLLCAWGLLLCLERGLEEAFGFFGGVPTEVLFDQMKCSEFACR